MLFVLKIIGFSSIHYEKVPVAFLTPSRDVADPKIFQAGNVALMKPGAFPDIFLYLYTGGLISHIPPYIHAWRTFSPSHIYLYKFSIDTNQFSSLSLSLLSGADCKQQIINIMGSF